MRDTVGIIPIYNQNLHGQFHFTNDQSVCHEFNDHFNVMRFGECHEIYLWWNRGQMFMPCQNSNLLQMCNTPGSARNCKWLQLKNAITSNRGQSTPVSIRSNNMTKCAFSNNFVIPADTTAGSSLKNTFLILGAESDFLVWYWGRVMKLL